MPTSEKTGVITLSVLDRLMDAEPKNRAEAMTTPAQSLRAMKVALRRDLEWLMNTRCIIQQAPGDCKELQRSVYAYGLPDVSSLSLFSNVDQNALLKSIERAVILFEPRLARPKVSLRPISESSRSVHFVIEGLLRVDPEPQPIVFDTVLELTSGSYAIQGDPGAR
jgi:type VI secretion system protein ImpF